MGDEMQWVGKISTSNKRNSKIGDHLSDCITNIVGSWQFVSIQLVLFITWITLNAVSWIKAWDPYPFILLNLVVSFASAFTTPIVLMSQNRQNIVDRQKAEIDYIINTKAEMEITLLNEKIDRLKEQEIHEIISIIRNLEKRSN